MKIYISILGAFGVTGETMRCIWNESHRYAEHEWMISPQLMAACIDRTRGHILADFMDHKQKPDVFLNIDDDVVLPDGGLLYVAEQAMKLDALVGPIVQKRSSMQGYSCRMPKGTNVPVGSEEPIPLGPGDSIGGACFAMPRSVAKLVSNVRTLDNFIPAHMPFLRRMRLDDGHLIPDPDGEYLEYVSEDFALTHRVQEAGGKAYLLPKLSCLHLGKFAFKPMHAMPQVDYNNPHFIQPRYQSNTEPKPTPKSDKPVDDPVHA